MHIHLNGYEQKLSHSQNWNLFHGTSCFYGSTDSFFWGRTSLNPERWIAKENASERVAFVVTSRRLIPKCTMVCAICGRTPLMMQSAPIRRAAVTVLRRCWATTVSTVGTPVMSMIATLELVCTIACSNDSITT